MVAMSRETCSIGYCRSLELGPMPDSHCRVRLDKTVLSRRIARCELGNTIRASGRYILRVLITNFSWLPASFDILETFLLCYLSLLSSDSPTELCHTDFRKVFLKSRRNMPKFHQILFCCSAVIDLHYK